MSFNYKPKIFIKNLEVEDLYRKYENFMKDPEFKKFLKPFTSEDTFCHYCENSLKLNETVFGIPVAIKEMDDKLQVDVCGSYCSFICSYKHYIKLEADSSKRKNIKFTDSGPFFKFLAYRIFKDYNIENHTEKIDLDKVNIELKHCPSNIIS